ncbi:MAG: Rpn family recombination-promoting nuclease/putative transposase [candidate division KSB1 bacterium]|nr:Rpn family recombination-promoting nuclease/putative transposase [candidate division KSB1 bacterium]MDZ7365667.1 Rpn family recombination-promoting nuclease/putative transposase [candidate division KSB1 bacterium]MDZ7403257.1 Rpn family recombination-promoting nuclease/putative transposase [candidate division KSB1 bacterium]
MKTDSIINRFFREFPSEFFALIGENQQKAERYEFVSVEVKEQAFRFDGVFKPKTNEDRLYFFEAQFKKDADFYLRFFGEVAVYLRQNQPENPWQATVLFPTPEFDPGVHQHYREFFESGRIKRIYLAELPAEVIERFPLNLLKILIDSNQEALATAETIIRQLPLQVQDEKTQETIVELLFNLLLNKLPQMSRTEIEKMFEPFLSDIKKSRAYQEIAEEGRQEKTREFARILLRKRMSLKFISEVTGLSPAELRALKKGLPQRKKLRTPVSRISEAAD